MDTLLIILPAVLFGICLSFLAIPLGLKVIKKGIIFLDIAIAQMAVLGSMIAEHIFEGVDDGNVYLVKTFSVCFSMLGSCFFYILNKKFNNFKSFESIIGITYVFMATICSLLLSIFHASFDSIEQIFAGKLLFLTYKELLQVGIIYLILGIFIYATSLLSKDFIFYMVFAVVVSLAMPIVGIYFMFSILIIPALLFEKNKYNVFFGILFSVCVIVLGSLYSLYKDYPSGLIIVIFYVFCGGLVYFFRKSNLLYF